MRGKRQKLHKCSVEGHGHAQVGTDHKHICEVVADADPLTRTQEKREWRRLEMSIEESLGCPDCIFTLKKCAEHSH